MFVGTDTSVVAAGARFGVSPIAAGLVNLGADGATAPAGVADARPQAVFAVDTGIGRRADALVPAVFVVTTSYSLWFSYTLGIVIENPRVLDTVIGRFGKPSPVAVVIRNDGITSELAVSLTILRLANIGPVIINYPSGLNWFSPQPAEGDNNQKQNQPDSFQRPHKSLASNGGN